MFSGIGGFALAARWANIETVQFVEIDKFCQKVLTKNFPGVPIHDDIKTFEFKGEVDLITGGFPCQPFSVAGSKKGVKDERYLWPEFFRIIKQSRPSWIVAENVPGIIPNLDPILENLEKESYTCWPLLIPASLVGATHKRERLWIIAYSDSVRCNIGQRIGQERYLQSNIKRHTAALQSKWSQFVPKSWSTFNAQGWLESIADTNSIASEQADQRTESVQDKRRSWVGHSGQDRIDPKQFNWKKNESPLPGVDDGLPDLVDRNKSLGNAIVPQVIYPIIEFIKELQDNVDKIRGDYDLP